MTESSMATQRKIVSCLLLAAAAVLACGTALAQISRIPVNALPNGPGSAPGIRQPQIVAGTFNPYQVVGNTATITQTNAAGILHWGSFDIGSGATVNIVQPSATSVLLNKVDGGAFLNRTVIDGILNGNGQVYIYNPNGIIFSKTSQVNVNSLVATALKIDDNRFLAGLIAPSVSPIFAAASGATAGAVVVEGELDGSVVQQAQINAARGGKILLIGSSVSNNGKLSAPDGQVLAAAGDKVYLAAPKDVLMRGLLVEVGTGGTVSNESLGKILVQRGNASLVGLAVNQNGNISATTSVQANGSIYLRARDGASKVNSQSDAIPTRGGTLTLGQNSVTQILPDVADKTTAPKTSYNPSQIDLAGKSVHFEQNAKVVAPGATVTVTAQADPFNRATQGITGGTVGGNGVYMEAGSSIDVAGTTNTQLAMESNVITVELRGTELADVPLQRDSILRGKTVKIDRRKGTPLANVQGYLDLVEYGIGEDTAAGGNITFSADQEVVLAEGAKLNVSGGMVNYLSGYVATTQLQSGNFTVDIGSASPDRIYTGLYDAVAGSRNFEAGYSEGRSAGSIRFDAPTLVLRGNLRGGVTPGVRQRDVTASAYPKGGEIVIGSNTRLESSSLSAFQNFSFLGNINFGGTTTAGVATPVFGSAWDAGNAGLRLLRSTLDINPTSLANGGFTRIDAYARSDVRPDTDPWGSTHGAVNVLSAVKLKPGGEFRVAAEETVSLNADMTIPGGTIEAVAATGRMSVGAGTALNVAGLWTNDRSTPLPAQDALGNPTAPIVIQGGSIVLSGKGSNSNNIALAVGDGASFDASGGAWQNASGKTTGGLGGAITLVASPSDSTSPGTAGFLLGETVDFRAYGLSKGGTLKLSGRNVLIGTATSADPLDLALGSLFFTEGGFSKYDITAAGNLTVVAGATISPRMSNWITGRDTPTSAGGSMADAFDVGMLALGNAQGVRGTTSLTLTASAKVVDGMGRLWLQQGAAIVTDPGATVTLSGGRQVTVDGRITDPGGTVSLLLGTRPDDADFSFRPERSIWLGSHAIVDVSGTAARLWNNSLGLTQGDVLDGGSIRIGRANGTDLGPAAGYVVIEDGALLDVSGTSASMTLSSGRIGLETRQVASAGGSIDIRARQGMLIEGQLSGAGGSSSAAGGSISLTLDRENFPAPAGESGDERNLVVLSQKFNAGTANESIVPAGLQADQAIGNDFAGKAYVLAKTLGNGGFDRIRLKSQDRITLDAAAGNVALAARGDIVIDAPVIAAEHASATSKATINAAHVLLGNSDWRYQAAGAAAASNAGNGATLKVTAKTIDIVGSSALQGFSGTQLNAREDIRLAGVVAEDLSQPAPIALPVIHAYGNFKTSGSLIFSAAQIYPTTMSEFSLSAQGPGSRIEFLSNGAGAAMPFSAAGTLTVSAENIVQDGILRAPFGNIALNATDTLSYGATSLTSVAGTTTIPLGRISNGRDWLYDFGNGHTVTLGNPSASNGVAFPEKNVTSTAAHIDLASGATIDLSGGGNLYAYEFTAGPGGSRDVLAKTAGASSATIFAVMPGFSSSFAPLDFQYQQDGGLQAGDRVYLSGMPGLAAGFYTLLPAHYALLPGAYAVTAASGTRDMSAVGNYARLDGSWLVAGYRGSAAAVESRWAGFVVTPSALVRTQSAFSDYSANAFFTALQAPLPRNGGHVVFASTETLTLDGLVKLGAVAGGRRGIADISAPDITVVSDESQDTGTAVKLVAAKLMALGADSLLLGATREIQSDGTHLTVGANSVTVANDATHPFTGSEIILAAKDDVTMSGGSVIAGSGATSGGGGDLIIEGSGANAEGALLRVSSGKQVAVVRDAPGSSRGRLTLEPGARVSATGSVNLDATSTLVNQGVLDLGTNTALSLGANRVSLGDVIPDSVGGLRFDADGLTALNKLANISLTSYSSFDFYGTVSLGRAATATLPATSLLSLRGGGIQFFGSATTDTVTLTANTVRFDGGGTFVPTVVPAAGTLNVVAKDIEVGSGSFTVNGFSKVDLAAQREVRAVGKAGVLSSDSDMTVRAGLITATTGADATVQSAAALKLTKVATPLAAVTTGALGGKLTFAGNTIASDALIVAKAGQISLAADQGVHVTGGEINAAGLSKTFGNTVAYAPGGKIALDGGSGDVTVDAGATLDVSATGADAGLIAVKATHGTIGMAVLNGTLKGSAVAGVDGKTPKQGRFSLDVDQVAQFGAMNQKLNGGGFTEARDLRIRQGDVTLASGESIIAHDVLIAADNGDVTVGGTINADGAKGGSIQIYASQASDGSGKGNVTLQGTAVLSARATQVATSAAGSAGDGGRVVIGTATADGGMVSSTAGNSSISLLSGATIDVSGKGLGQDGTVVLRAPRVGSSAGSDVAISSLAATIIGSSETSIEGFKTYDAVQVTEAADGGGNLDATSAGTMYTEASSFSDAVYGDTAISSRLRLDNDVNLRAGIEVRSAGDLLVSVNESKIVNNVETTSPKDRGWNLNEWRFNNQPGVLTLRAANNLTIRGSISDGFVKPAGNIAMPGWELDGSGGASWSYRLAGGADMNAANPLNVVAREATGTNGDVALRFARTASTPNDQPVALIRTGSGRIDIAAGRDVVLDSVTVRIPNLSASITPDPFASASTVSAVLGATIYTAGRFAALESGFLAPKNQTVNSIYTKGTKVTTNARFAEDGGGISIEAGRDVVGAVTRQMVNNWLFRRGKVTTDASGNTIFAGPLTSDGNTATTRYETVLSTGWWTRYDFFNQGIATFGGGDVSVTSGRNVENLSLNVATSGQVPADANKQPTTLVERGGGDIVLRAAGDIRGGSYYVQKGDASLSAGGAVVAGNNVVPDEALGQVTLRPVLALGDGKININAVGNVEIETVFNPTLVRQSTNNADADSALKRQSPLSVFATYEADGAVGLTSFAGDVALGNHAEAVNNASAPWKTVLDATYLVYPASLRAAALSGNISFDNGFSLWSSPVGQLELLAEKSVTATYPRNPATNLNIAGAQPIVMIDAAPASLPNILAPLVNTGSITNILNPVEDTDGLAYHTSGGLHAGDNQPVRIVALTGDIIGESYFGGSNIHDTLIVPKSAEILAGRDIRDFGFKIQHLSQDDVSTVTAGRDFIDTTYPDLSPVRHNVTGPGRLDITAGRDIDLGTSSGIVTRGNLDNPYLPDGGAGINLLAGAKADYAKFVSLFLKPQDLPVADQADLIAYVRALDSSQPSSLSAADALALFKALPAGQQAGFLVAKKAVLNDVFFKKLQLVTGSIGKGTLDLAGFDALIASLYPTADISGGNINVFGSQLKTARGGSINIFAPGGSVQAGLAEKPAWVKSRLNDDKSFESNLGVYTIAGGNLQSLVKKDFLVNQGRVFTLGGGDITLVSQYGDIDAGKGAKTSQSTPPPVIRTDKLGNTVVDISSSISGSGIATLRTSATVLASSVYPIAPRGVFDAGDAGVRSTGTVNIVAQTVLNANNINASGGVSGAQTATGGLSGAVATPSNTPATKTDTIASAANPDSRPSGSLTVELLGYGGDGQQNVTEDSQNAPSDDADDTDDETKKKKLKKKQSQE